MMAEVERALAGGGRVEKGGALHGKVEVELRRLREDNDRITSQVLGLKKARAQLVATEDDLISKMRHDGDVHSHGPSFASAVRKIEEVDSELAGLRCQQLVNSRDVAELKLGKVRIETREEVAELVRRVDEALAGGLDASGLQAEVQDLVKRLRDEFDASAHAVSATTKELDNTVGRLRNLELSIRVRRGRIDAETDALRGQLVSAFFEAKRKNSRLMRIRDSQAQNAKDINVLERALDRMARDSKIKEVLASGDKQRLSVEASALWEDIEQMQKALLRLEEVRDRHSEEVATAIADLRTPDMVGTVSAETGARRERLIAALREEELCAQRLAMLRNVQALDIELLRKVKSAMAQ